MKVLAIYGSPRKDGNSANMMNTLLSQFPEDAQIHRVYLGEQNIAGCGSCRKCKQTGHCVIEDDMQKIYEELLRAQIIILASPVLFSDVGSDIKKLMERTWCMKGKLKNKIGGYLISGRRYMESAANTLQAFMLRHRMILGGSGTIGITFTEMGGLEYDPLALRDAMANGQRLIELYNMIYGRQKIDVT